MQPKSDAKVVLPPIPAKRYFTIGEVSELCGVKPHVLRYWEQEFTQLRPMKRRGNRRYYQHHEVLLVRRIRELLYEQGFTISGARNRLGEAHGKRGEPPQEPQPVTYEVSEAEIEEIRGLLTDALAMLTAEGAGGAPVPANDPGLAGEASGDGDDRDEDEDLDEDGIDDDEDLEDDDGDEDDDDDEADDEDGIDDDPVDDGADVPPRRS